MEEKGANVRRKSEKRKPPRARREKILNYRKWPRRPCRNSMNCVTYRNVIRTSPGGAYAHMRTHERERERERESARGASCSAKPSACRERDAGYRRIGRCTLGLTTVEIATSRLSHKAGGCRARVDA